jgi:DNA-directed RNA polymerase subunit RPC12/RpoP
MATNHVSRITFHDTMSFDRLGDHQREQAGELFRLGRTCIKTGDVAQGRKLLLEAVDKDRQHSEAWLWLSATTSDPSEQKKYLEWAIAADPGNAQARRGLALLTGKLKREDVLPEGDSAPEREPVAPQPVAIRRTFDCPQCGGRLRFDPTITDLKCEHCGFVEVVEEVALRDGAQPLDFVLPTVKAHAWAMGERLFVCEQCAATTLLPSGEKSTACPFCGNAALIAAPEDSELVVPQGILPMTLEAERVYDLVRAWLGQGLFIPDNLKAMVRDKNLRPAYVPCWVFEASLTAKWRAEVQEGYGREARWLWRTGDETFFFTDQMQPASRALPHDLMNRLPAFDLKQLVVFKPEYVADWPMAQYDRSLADASLRAREVMVKRARPQLRERIAPGRAARNVEISTDAFTGELYKLVLLPLWIGTYAYGGRPYRVLVNGQTGAVAGEKPLDALKVWLAAVAAAGVLLFFGLLVFVFLARP